MTNSLVEPGNTGKDERNRINRYILSAADVFLSEILQLSNDDKNDLFEALLSLKDDPSRENLDAVERTLIEILSKETVKAVAIDLKSTCPSNWSVFVAQKSKKLRKASKITQKKLAELTGLQQAHISRIERGELSPTRKTVEKLANAFAVDVSFFDPSA